MDREPDSWWKSVCETINHEYNRKLFSFPANLSLKISGMYDSLRVSERSKDRMTVGFNVRETQRYS